MLAVGEAGFFLDGELGDLGSVAVVVGGYGVTESNCADAEDDGADDVDGCSHGVAVAHEVEGLEAKG